MNNRKIDPLDLTLREIASICGDSSYEDVNPNNINFDGPPQLAIENAFEEIHPASVAEFVRHIDNGLERGYTAQGSKHKVYQDSIKRISDSK